MPPPVKLSDLMNAYLFVSANGGGEQEAFLCRESGKIYYCSNEIEKLDPLPEDLDDDQKYFQIPDTRTLDLGKPLALEFARQFMPADFDDIHDIFNRKGAFRQFKALLTRKGALDKWHEFEAEAEEQALREWCEINSIDIDET